MSRVRGLSLFCVAALMGVAVSASANPGWTGPGMTYVGQEIVDGVTQIEVTFPGPNGAVKAVLCMTDANGKRPAIVIAHDGEQGLAGVKARARDLARQGYVVLAPGYAATSGAIGTTSAAPNAVQTLVDAGTVLAQHPNVYPNRMAIMGSSHGGHVAMLAAGQDRDLFSCAVIANPAIDVAAVSPVLKTTTLIQHGGKDQVSQMSDARHLNYEIKKHGGASELKEYTLLGHGFWFYGNSGHPSEIIAQANWAWDDATEYLDKKLTKGLPSVASK